MSTPLTPLCCVYDGTGEAPVEHCEERGMNKTIVAFGPSSGAILSVRPSPVFNDARDSLPST